MSSGQVSVSWVPLRLCQECRFDESGSVLCALHEDEFCQGWASRGLVYEHFLLYRDLPVPVDRMRRQAEKLLQAWLGQGAATAGGPVTQTEVSAWVERRLCAAVIEFAADAGVARVDPVSAVGFLAASVPDRTDLELRAALGLTDFDCPARESLVWAWLGVDPQSADVFSQRLDPDSPTWVRPVAVNQAVPARWSGSVGLGARYAFEWVAHLQLAGVAEAAASIDTAYRYLARPADLAPLQALGLDEASAARWHRNFVDWGLASQHRPSANVAGPWLSHGYDLSAVEAWVCPRDASLGRCPLSYRSVGTAMQWQALGFATLTEARPWLDLCRDNPAITPEECRIAHRDGVPPDWLASWRRGEGKPLQRSTP